MKTQIGNHVFIIKFGYSEYDKQFPNNPRDSFCYIKVGATDTLETYPLLETHCRNDSRDNFSKANGRLVAFKKAMGILFNDENRVRFGLTKEDKYIFWQDLKDQCPTTFRNL